MREPRSKQRFPHGGKGLYELLRMDHEPVFVRIWPSDEVSREVANFPDTLTFEKAFDPMVYFWPVEGQHVVADFKAKPDKKDEARLVKALQRDGAAWITVMWKDENKRLHWESYGDAAEFMLNRYGVSPLDIVALPSDRSRASLARTAAVSTDSGCLTDRQRQDGDCDGAAVAGPGEGHDRDVHGTTEGTAAPDGS